jgi:hypothetical protein
MNYQNRLLLCLYFLLAGCSSYKEAQQINRINGASFVSPSKEIPPNLLAIPKKEIEANWLCFMPYGFIDKSSNKISYNQEWQWWGEKSDGINSLIEMAQDSSYKIMLKPHVWIKGGFYTGHLNYETENYWVNFENSYQEYILHYAEIAERHGIEIFCIGTEWAKFIEERELFWENLIYEVRKIYSGKITYASNWDEFKNTPFWNKLDYIGINAYFPVSNEKTPTADLVEDNLAPIKNTINSISDSLNKQVIFTEYGYRSVDFSGMKPWESKQSDNINIVAQTNCLEGFFECFWKEENIAGGFLWKWFHNHNNSGGLNNSGYTPQNKDAEKIIRNYYFSE